MKSTSLISVTAILLGGCATGTKFDQGGPVDLEVPSPALPGFSANGNPMDPQAQLPGSGGGGGEASLPGGTGGSPDPGPSSTVTSSSSSSSVSSSSSSGGGNPPPPVDPPQMACNPGLTLCGDTCSDTKKDALNCGACGHACKEGQFCSEGKCSVTATLYFAGDDAATVYIDGQNFAPNKNWFVATKVTFDLQVGPHVIGIRGDNLANGTNPGAVILDMAYGSTRIVTGTSDWLSTTIFEKTWNLLGGGMVDAALPTVYGDIFNPVWWNRDPVTFAAKNFPNDSKAQWVWSDGYLTDGTVYFRKDFTVD